MEYQNECYKCGELWDSNDDLDPCPNCGEIDDVGTDVIIGDYND